MNIAELAEEIAATPWPEGGPAREKEYAQSLLVRFCAILKEESRDPDAWEALYTLAAVGAITGQMYSQAVELTSRAFLPESRRADLVAVSPVPVALGALQSAVGHLKQSTVPGG